MFLGIDIGGTKCAVVVGDKNGTVISKIRFETESVDATVEKIRNAALKLSEEYSIKACGISCGGPLDEKKGIVLSPPNLPDWDNIKICEIMQNTLGVPCGIRNDANACALAEYRFGAGKGTSNMVFMTFGTGLGAGIILNGSLYSGTNGNAGEVGHIRLADDGPVGYGKSGSFEGFCSGGGIMQLAKTVAEKNGMPEWAKKPYTVADIADYARAGDKTALEIFELSGRKLGLGLSVIIDILNPEKIIIGSIYARCRDLLEKPMREVLELEALSPSASVCEITTPKLGESIGDAGALAVAWEVYDELY